MITSASLLRLFSCSSDKTIMSSILYITFPWKCGAILLIERKGEDLMKYIVEIATKRNTKFFDKPNEDCVLVDVDNGIFIILDGVTRDREDGHYPDPSPSFEVSKLFLKKAHESLISFPFNENESIEKAFSEGNREIKKFNRSYSGSFLPGTVGIIAILRNNKLFYGYIGDCIGMVVNENCKKKFTTCQTKLIHQHSKEFTAYQIRHIICNNIYHPYSYGVLDGRESALDFVIIGKMNIDKYKKILLFTDGLEEIVKQMSIKELISLEAVDILNSKLGNKSTDDKTVIVVELDNNENNDANN